MAQRRQLETNSSDDEESEELENPTLVQRQNNKQVEESSEEEEGSESESEDAKQPEESLPKTPEPNNDSSSTESGCDSGSIDSPSASAFKIKPIVPKPLQQQQPTKTNTPVSKPVKRPAETEHQASTNKKTKLKPNDVAEEDVKKGPSFQRLWSENDEVAILKGVIEYKANKGVDPSADMIAFHEFIKKSINVDVSKSQLSEKLRRLKKKYTSKGEDAVFSKPHECMCFELSKKIWGRGDGDPKSKQNGKANGKEKDLVVDVNVKEELTNGNVKEELANGNVNEEIKGRDVWSSDVLCNYPLVDSSLKWFANFDKELLRDGLRMMEVSKIKELESKWNKLQERELEVHIMKVDLIKEQSQAVLEALKSSMP